MATPQWTDTVLPGDHQEQGRQNQSLDGRGESVIPEPQRITIQNKRMMAYGLQELKGGLDDWNCRFRVRVMPERSELLECR